MWARVGVHVGTFLFTCVEFFFSNPENHEKEKEWNTYTRVVDVDAYHAQTHSPQIHIRNGKIIDFYFYVWDSYVCPNNVQG